MDPNSRGPEEEYGHGAEHHDTEHHDTEHHDSDQRDDSRLPARRDTGGGLPVPAYTRTVQLAAGEYLLTVNPIDGSEIEPRPPGEHPGDPARSGPEEREALRRAAMPPVPVGPSAPDRQPLLDRDEERERLVRLLSHGRSVRITGPSGSGRTALLDAVAADCADLAPDGLIRLSGCHRTPTDLLHELYATVYHAPLCRPEQAELLAAVRRIGAVVVLDDIEFGGTTLDELLKATPECAFLISATPDVAAPSPDSHLEEIFLSGLSRTACTDLLERAVQRPLTESETAWAADLWFESEGLPLRFVQAAVLLAECETTLPSVAEAAAPAALLAAELSEPARDTLRFAVALGGECPHQAHLPALIGDTHADAAVGELLGCGLLTPVGAHYRLTTGVTAQLEAAGYGDDAPARAQSVAQHYAWWAGHLSVTPERAATEADAMLAALAVLTGRGDAGQRSAAVLLARTAAPAFAAALNWSAWERALRHGQEAARLAGEVAEEAYFHHELGILALCTGNPGRARAELEASIALRRALSDKRGAVAGRRALALVTDKVTGNVPGAGVGVGVGRTAPGEEIPKARTNESALPPRAVRAALVHPDPDEAATVVTRQPGSAAPTGGTGPGQAPGKRSGVRGAVLGGARRNLVAVGTGALLAAVLGTVVTIGATSGGEDSPADSVESWPTAGDDDGYTIEEPPTQDATSPSKTPERTGEPTTARSQSPSHSATGEPSAGGKLSSSKSKQPDPGPTTRPPSPSKSPKPSSSTSSSPSSSASTSESPSASTSPEGDTANSASQLVTSSSDGSESTTGDTSA